MDFGMKLQKLRKEKGLSQEELAQQLNVSRQAVSKWESSVGYPEIDKLIIISQLFEVSIDYLIKDNPESIREETDSKYFMNSQKIQEYIKFHKGFALGIGLCVSMMILSTIIPVMCDRTAYDTVGQFIFLVIIALAVFGLIVLGISSEKYSDIKKQEISMTTQDAKQLNDEYQHFHSYFGISIAFGVFLIIISVALIVLLENANINENIGASQLLACTAISVFIFIYQGMKYYMYQFLVMNEKYIEDVKREEKSLFQFTMPIAAIAYVALGLTMNWWHPGWLIFPITAIVTGFVEHFRNEV